MLIKKAKTNTYLKTEKSVILERLDKKFKDHEQIELKIVERANGLKNGQNKLADYIAIQKLIDTQLKFLNELDELSDSLDTEKRTPTIREIINVLRNIFKR